jgi:hypothetical protein
VAAEIVGFIVQLHRNQFRHVLSLWQNFGSALEFMALA